MKDDYDVIVIGAGPAGSIAAQNAAAESDVLLVEKRQEIGAPVRCAEAVPLIETPQVFHTSFENYVKLDRKWVACDVNAVRATGPDGTVVEVSGDMLGREEPLGIVLDRKLLDRQLAKDAARAGAHVMVRTRATQLILDDGKVRGVKLRRLGEEFEARSKVVIGADGVESQVGRWAGVNTTLRPKDIESCAQYHMQNVELRDGTIDFYFGSVAPGGYAWAFPKGDGAANVGLGVLGSKLNDKRPLDFLNEWVAQRFSAGKPVELVMGACPVSDALSRTVGDGLMLVGDAAHHTDPITGGGIMAALQSGTLAAQVASKAVRQNDSSIKVLREYETEWARSFGKGRKRTYKAKEWIVNLSDEEISRIFHVFAGITAEELNPKGVLKRLLRLDPRLLFSIRRFL
ncbi:MAG TPA: NAD(P)/FAD-dependent oxidoreductase [Candidatus Bathyarchaeia archaeon]|nr:NAD(P)/FAD-dependent oxidoreductase [Candidatus Bathyarchaeia archaeon]